MEIIRIPAERVSILIGEDGQTKKKIEEKCGISLDIDSEGEVTIEGEPSEIFFCKDIILAIGRGFAPRVALKLYESEHGLFIFNLRDILSTDKAIRRMKGRVIGEDGKTRLAIEEATDSYISVYGHTIAVISKMDSMHHAREAIGLLLEGANHSTVYGYLAKAKRQIIESRLKS
jgi:ribosomal RNA assembly protein